MYNSDADLLFPTQAIVALVDERGKPCMNACSTCNSDSFRAMNGCSVCARQSLKRFRGTDQELLSMYHEAKNEVEEFIQKNGN